MSILKEDIVGNLADKRILRSLVIASTIAVVVCYAWLASHVMEPQFSTPAYVAETFVRTPESHLFRFDEKFRQWPRESERIESETTSLEPSLNWLGALRLPIEIVVDEKQTDRLLVTDTRVEIGRDVLLARGQLSKAILKSWILQNASPLITSSHLRLEVASDVLLGMLKGSLELEVPGVEEPITFSDAKSWWTYADSYRGVCNSAWKSIELAGLCSKPTVQQDAVNVSELSFREFLGTRVWTSYKATPMRARLSFIRAWVAEMKVSRGVVVPSLKAGWLAVVQGELDALLPSAIDPLVAERAKWNPLVEAPLIVIDSDGRISAPGTLRLVANDLLISHAHLGMMTSCEAPLLKDVMSISVPVERVVWRPECAEKKSDFAQVRPSAIRIALARGLARATDRLDQFILKNHLAGGSSYLGIADAKWDSRIGAYQVRGAIQAVDAFRLKGTSPN